MENTNTILAQNIKKYRLKSGITQEELASRLGVTYQAVSKWENEKAAPDISFLPDMAEIFGCSIDELFGKASADKIHGEIHYDLCTEFPWADDNTLRGIVCLGRKMLRVSEDGLEGDRFTFEVTSETGEIGKVYSEWSIAVSCNVSGGCESGGDVYVSGSMFGGCNAGRDVYASGPLSGGCNVGGDVVVSGPLSGGCNTGGDLTVGGSISGNITCGDSMTVDGSIEAEMIRCGDNITVTGGIEATSIYGEVICNEVKCEKIEGDVTILKK